jgi:formiminotetrahydrofolate cyclodeaminase
VEDVPFADHTLEAFLARLASDEPAPGGGAAAALTTAMAAGLVAMAARFSTGQVDDAAAVAEEADRLRHQALALADEDATAYEKVLAAYRLPREPDPDGRRQQIRQAFEAAADVPLEVARLAAEVAVLGERLADRGNPNLEGDALAGVVLARAAARAAGTLVELNVAHGKLDGERLDRLARHLDRAG